MRVPHVLVPGERRGGERALPPAADHHLRRVLRLRPGAAITVTDGAGGFAPAVLTGSGAEVGAWQDVPREAVVTLHPALTKGAKLDLVVEKATELGVGAVRPVVCERSERRWDGERAAAALRRWEAVAAAALTQSGSVWLPTLSAPLALGDVVSSGTGVLLDPAGRSGEEALGETRPLALLTGPEGGFTDGERTLAEAHGWTSVRLGNLVMRAETAAVVGLALVQAAHGAFRGTAAPPG